MINKVEGFFLCLIFLSSCQEKSTVNSDVKIKEPNEHSVTYNEQDNSDSLNNCAYDNPVVSIGIGLVQGTDLVLYNDSTFEDLFIKYNIGSGKPINKRVCSKYYKPEYYIMHFVCLSETNKYYKVIINYDEIKYLVKDSTSKLLSWEDYILSSFGIRPNNNQELKKQPHLNSDKIENYSSQDIFCPIEVKGEWVKVRFDCQNDSELIEPCNSSEKKCPNETIGWLKWKKGNEILVEIFLLD